MFTPSLSNHAERHVNFSRNNANFHIQFTFSRLEICPITRSRFPLGGPVGSDACLFIDLRIVRKFSKVRKKLGLAILDQKKLFCNCKMRKYLNQFAMWDSHYSFHQGNIFDHVTCCCVVVPCWPFFLVESKSTGNCKSLCSPKSAVHLENYFPQSPLNILQFEEDWKASESVHLPTHLPLWKPSSIF